ncbi:AAA family ATPase [Nakamurella flava]|uniref:AAA family ATPase n=1 Tax=Nakamurella flava TaxID=2576308 RepID=A0A4U6QKQ7_9ACTN|nr:RNA polymerase recycling motor ATPase HelR [Nakamurella flava]TKV60869.1 AAA family ATPase [Nakamurella flava]
MSSTHPPTDPRATVFALPACRSAKAAAVLVAEDERFFTELRECLAAEMAAVDSRLATTRREAGQQGRDVLDREGPVAMERDQEIHRLTARHRDLQRYGLDLCLGRVIPLGGGAPRYIGRRGVSTADGRTLLVDWRSPGAEPFFAATHGDPRGLRSRRRYHWTAGRITDYWDEVFDRELLDSASGQQAEQAAFDDQSAFLASLGASRTDKMRDVLGTIAADQDAIIRADSAGALVVDGGPGTGKTVVALHRTAYLLYADPRLGHRRGGVLFIGPHRQYLSYVGDVLPSLGEEGVLTTTLRDLVPEGVRAQAETDPQVARWKGDADVSAIVDAAVRFHEDPPTDDLVIETDWRDHVVTAADWAAASAAVRETGVPHNEAREPILNEIVDILLPKDDVDGGDVEVGEQRRALRRHRDLRATLHRAWPMIEATDLIGDLWTVRAYLRRCAPDWDNARVDALQRREPTAWTVADLPWLDAACRRLGDSQIADRRRRRAADEQSRERAMSDVVDHLMASDDTELQVMSMFRIDDMRAALIEDDPDDSPRDRFAGPFAHVVVDEAQELTRAEWQMLLARCPSQSFTIAGDRAQSRVDTDGPWTHRLTAAGFRQVREHTLTINYRTPEEVMEMAAPVILAAVPDATVPVSVRRSGRPVHCARLAELDQVVRDWLRENDDGVACVIGAADYSPPSTRVRSLDPLTVKGLEFDLVVLVDPDEPLVADPEHHRARAVDRYVAMTRSTGELVMVSR